MNLKYLNKMTYRNCFLTALLTVLICSCNKESRKAEFLLLSTNEVKIDGSTENGVEFNAALVLESNESILEEGFVYDLEKLPSIEKSSLVRMETPISGSYSLAPEDALMPDTTYYVRSFARTGKATVYGNQVSFYSNGSLPPVIDQIVPQLAFWQDTVKIIGSNFDHSGMNNSVFFDQFSAQKTWGTKDTIFAIVPAELNVKKSRVSVKVYGKKSSKAIDFEFLSPVIGALNKSEGQYPDTVTLTGDYFSAGHGRLYFGNHLIVPEEVQQKQIKFVVPFLGEGADYPVRYAQLDDELVVEQAFKYRSQSITGLAGSSIYATDSLTIYGTNVDFRTGEFEIFIQENKCRMVEKYQDSLVVIPDIHYTNYSNSEFSLECRLSAPHSPLGTCVYSAKVGHKLPVIEALSENKLAYGSPLEIYIQGTYYNGAVQYRNIDEPEITGTISYGTNYEDEFYRQLPYQMIPGRYQIWIDSFGRLTNKVELEIPVPVVHTVSSTVMRRNNEEVSIINGDYLPKKGAYILQHKESGRIFSVSRNGGAFSIVPNEIQLYGVMGAGTFELKTLLNNRTYDTGILFELDDYLEYHLKYEPLDFLGYNNFAFTKDDKLYYAGGYNEKGFVIDLNTGVETKLASDFFPVPIHSKTNVPIFFNQEVYAIFQGKLFKFDSLKEKWEAEDLDTPDDELTAGCVINGRLQVFTTNGKSYIKDTTWKTGPVVNDLQGYYPRFATEHNGTLYLYFAYGIQTLSTQTWKLEKWYPSPVDPGNMFKLPQHVFQQGNNIYMCYMQRGTYISKILRFVMDTNSYELPEPDYLPDDDYEFKFAPDQDGEVFLLNKEYVYKLRIN
ncbi:MAG: IPT/TIG domain-containing protein [Marinilabiliaceae bacterium]|nr:IPT/TIG domain-containing protein [Marinilabiliaceae bacterium]